MLTGDLKAIDASCALMCMENNLPIIVFDLNSPDGIIKVANGENIGTTIYTN